MNFKKAIGQYHVSDFDLRKRLIKGFLGIWIVLTILPILVFGDYIYDIDILKQNFKNDLFSIAFESSPKTFQTFIKVHPYSVAAAVYAVVFLQFFEKRFYLLWSFLLCILFGFHFRLTSLVGSGATVIVATFLSFIVLLDFFEYLESKLKAFVGTKHYVFLAMKLQICMVYLVSGLVKVFSPLWTSGSAMYYILLNTRYFKYPAVVDVFVNADFALSTITILPLIYLFLFPFLVWTKKGPLIILASFIFHGFIALAMGLREFMVFPVLDFLLFCDVTVISKFATRLLRFDFSQRAKASQNLS